MKRKFTLLAAALMLLSCLAIPLGMWGQTRTKITDYTQIVSGKTYYIGATLSNNTDYYFAAAHTYNSPTGIQGTSVTSQSDASVMTFVGSGTTWTIIFDNGKYLQLNSSNGGKVNILDANTTDIPTFTASTNNSLIRLTNSNTYLQRNNTAGTARFGSYSGTQTDIWLMEVPEPEPTCTASPTSWDFGSVQVDQSASKTFTITTANLTDDIDLAFYDDDAFSVSPTTIAASATSTDVTVTFHPTTIPPNNSWGDALLISSDDFSDVELIALTGTALCNDPANALAYTSPVNLTLSGDYVNYTLAPTANTGNGGNIEYELTTNPGGNGMVEGNVFTAVETGTYVVRATQALSGTTCGGTADITINVVGTDPMCTIEPDSYEFGTVITGSTQSTTFTVTTANLTDALTVAIDNTDKGFSVSPTSIAQNATSTTVTVTYAPTVVHAEVYASLSITGGGLASDTEAVITGTATDGYTITFDAGTGSCTTTQMTGQLPGAVITLPEASTVTAPEGWTFVGWCATEISTATTTQPTLLTDSYTVTGNATIYAVYSKTEGSYGDITYVFKDQGFTNGQVINFATMDASSGIGWSATKGTNDPAYYSTGEGLRVYNGGSFSVTANGNTITAVSLTFSGSYTFSSGASNPTTWSGSQSTDISWSVSQTCRLQKVEVTYDNQTITYHTSPTAKVATPTITVAGTGTGATNTYYETATVTLACTTEGATIHYTTDGTDPTASSPTYSTPFAVTDNATIKAIAVKDGCENSEMATQELTIVHRNAIFTDGVYSTLNSSSTYNEWYAITVTGSAAWAWNSGGYARISGSNNTEAWLVSPKMAVVNGKLNVSFEAAARFGHEGEFKAYYSTNYPGYGDPTSSTWTEAAVTLPYENNYTFESKNIDLTGSFENVYFAFKATLGGVYELKNFTAKQCYPVTYNANGGTGTMTDANSPYAVGATVTTLANTFTAPEGMVFEVWNDGTNNYAGGATFNMPNAAVELSAQWMYPCTVMATMASTEAEAEYINDAGNKSYKINMSSSVSVLGGCDISEYGFVYSTSETTPTIENATKVAVGTSYTTANTVFEGEIANATGTYYVRSFATNAAGTAYSASAVTVVVPNTYPTWTISYKTNGNDEVSTSSVDRGDAISTFITPTTSNIPTGYTFAGWSASETSTTIVSSLTPDADATLYAVMVPAGSVSGYVRVTENLGTNWAGDYLIAYSNAIFADGRVGGKDGSGIGAQNVRIDLSDYIVENTIPTAYGDLYNVTLEEISTGSNTYVLKTKDGKYNYQSSNANGLEATLYIETASARPITVNFVSEDEINLALGGSAEGAVFRYNTSGYFRYYKDGGQKPVYLYKKYTTTPLTRVYTKEITGYGDDNTVETGWHLIASPVAISPENVTNMTTETYDLYKYDEANHMWRNYKKAGFSLVSGEGYLYAHNNSITLSFPGVPYSGNGQVTLSKQDNSKYAGWNLVGNPFGDSNAIIAVEENNPARQFYRMNGEGSDVVPASGPIAAMEGVFVVTESDGEVITFEETDETVESLSKGAAVVMNLVRNRGSVIDRAIVHFDESEAMPKFQLFENSTKLYIAQNGEEYASVQAEVQGEMPVSFRANENGQYTLTVNPEGVEMNYLHLIDNMTGTDVDLLATPSYTFNAKKNDLENRFKLVFAANNGATDSAADPTFAFFSNGNLIINNAGEATLQVIDITGRVLSSETINGGVSIGTSGLTAGVYVLRLVNGKDVKTQKIVVE